MNSLERIQAAVNFQRPDRIPRWDNFSVFGNFPERWRKWKNFPPEVNPEDFYKIDVFIASCDEGPFFSQAEVLGYDSGYEVYRDAWGRSIRQKPGDVWLMQTVQAPLDEKRNLDHLEFEDPTDERRYVGFLMDVDRERKAGRMIFPKVGGLYCRSHFMRREEQLLLDMLEDEIFCHDLFRRVSGHLTQVALEELRRSNSWDAGIWFYDDSASLRAPMFSPSLWERYFLPRYSEMIEKLRSAGCRHFYLHSDGNIGPFLPLMIEAGLEGFNPLEPRCLDIFELRRRYGNRIVLFGGMCNTRVLPSGDKAAIENMVKCLVELGRDGGLVIGSASIGDDISPESYDFYIQSIERYSEPMPSKASGL